MPQQSANNPLGIPFIELQSVDSTNNYALAQVHAGLAQHGQAIFAHEQVAGRGQRGRNWTSEKGSNIILSLVINPHPLLVSQQFWLSAAIAVAIREFFQKFAGDDAKIKWPNDLYWQDRKAGGILIESVIGGRITHQANDKSNPHTDHPAWKWAVAGIGININQTLFPEGLVNPVSLKQITGKTFNSVILARELCTIINSRFHFLLRDGFDAILQEYNDHLYKKHESVKLRKDSRVFDAVIDSVAADGTLTVTHALPETFTSGEVEWIL